VLDAANRTAAPVEGPTPGRDEPDARELGAEKAGYAGGSDDLDGPLRERQAQTGQDQ
jgi:hypothetical protein